MLPDVMRLDVVAGVVELLGALIIAAYAVGSLIALARPGSRDRIRAARLHLAEGVLAGLTFKVAATLLKTLILFSWHQIAAFAAVLALRTLLKHLFAWEAAELSRSKAQPCQPF